LDYSVNEIFAIRVDEFVPARKFRKSISRPVSSYAGYTEKQLPGVCAVFVAQNAAGGDNTIEKLPDTSHYGEQRFLLKGSKHYKSDFLMDDENEVILADHKIIAIIQNA
jgi:hypothetical protein